MEECSLAAGARFGVAHFQVPLRGGFATYAGPESPYNKVAGVGFDGVPDDAELHDLEQLYAEHGAPVSFEVSTLADPGVVQKLTGRGYRLTSFEDVLVRGLDDEQATTPDDIEILRDDGTGDPGWTRTWLDVVVEAALHPDTDGLAQYEEVPRQSLEQAELAGIDAGVRTYVATIDGTAAGGAGIRFADGIAQLAGAGTIPAFRRRGVQTALVGARLSDARLAACDIAVVTAQPGSPSHANTQRMGFDLGYARAVLVKEP
jgi:GNAT superfamily N-acetyltransferase